jgi:hypothetical protein
MLNQLKSPTHNLIEVGKKDVFHKLLEHHSVEDLPNYVANERLFESDKGMLENMKTAYGSLAGTRQNLNLTFKNVLLCVIVCNNVTFNQRHITRSLGASRYFVQNVVVRRIDVDQTWQNFLGGMP